MKKIVLFLFLVLSFGSDVLSQIYGNEWISYDQKYFTFPIVNTGIYKLDYAALNASGIPLTTFTAQNIQIFGREKEVPLHIEDGGDSSIDPGDYILFYAQKNDGWLDSTLYQDPNKIGNPSYSLVNDTINYFFTWNSSTSNLRYTVESDVSFSSYTPANYIIQKVESSYGTYYNLGGGRISFAASSLFMPGEGFGLAPVNGASGYTLALNVATNSPYTGIDAPSATFKGISTTNSDAPVDPPFENHHMNWKIGSSDLLLFDQISSNYQGIFADQTFSSSILTDGLTPLKWSIIGDQGAATDYQSLNYWAITYPKKVTLDGTSSGNFQIVNATLGSKIRLDFTNSIVNNPVVFVLGSMPIKASISANGAGYSTLIPNSLSGVNQQVVIRDFSSLIPVTTLKMVNGTGIFTDYSLLNADSALLLIYHSQLSTSVIDYQTYRQSIAGGSYSTIMANVEELYLQFGGGINKHINAIRRFSHLMYNGATKKPVALFLVGKGISIADSGWPYGSPGSRTNTSSYAMNGVPTFGEPASDVAITSYLTGSTWKPLIPTGRISVKTNLELTDYLSKVKEFELQQDPNSVYNSDEKDWQKQVLHFGGGLNLTQQSTFRGFLNSMKATIEDSNYAGNVHSYFKTSSAPIDPDLLSIVTNRIQKGVSLMTFFGHAAPAVASGFDINIDVASEWNNVGKYPVVLANSCWAGNMFVNTSTPSVSERFVNLPQEGAIAFIGSSADGLDQPLNTFSNDLYAQFSYWGYGKTLSEQLSNTIDTLQVTNGNSIIHETTAMQMNLLGDPLLRLNWHENPEIELTADKVSFSPEDLDLTVDSITVSIVLTNLGRAIVDTFTVEIRRDFPLLSVDSIYEVRVPRLNYKDTIHYTMALQNNIGVGINNITVAADIPSVIPEQYDEIENNRITKTLFVDIDGILPVIPYDFAVVPIDSVTVKASTINPVAAYNTYRFEIDTTDLFNSPEWRYANVSGLGGVKEVNPSEWKSVATNMYSKLVCTDSTVYFWRVSIDSSVYDWRERSFQYIIGKTGWGQEHFFQFKKNGFNNIIYNRATREREFTVDPPDTLRSFVHSAYGVCASYLNGQKIEGAYCVLTPSLMVVIIDPITHIPWGTRYVPTGENLTHNFGNQNDNGACSARTMYHFVYPTNSATYLNSFRDLVLNQVPDGFYLLIYTTMGARYDWWNTYYPSVAGYPTMYDVFASLGSDSIVPGRPNLPFSFFCKKGDPNSVIERFALTGSAVIDYNIALEKVLGEGAETSTLIGPASKWGNVYWKQDPLDLTPSDSTELKIKVYNHEQAFQYEFDTLFTHNDSIVDLNTMVDASLYPYIKLEANYFDTSYFVPNPAQVDRWHVLFEPVPEAAIDATNGYTWLPSKDTLNEGEIVKFAIDIKNIFTIDMDSLLVKYWVEDNAHVKHPIAYLRQDSLVVNEVFRDTIEFSTIGLVGINSLWMEVNPYVAGSLYITDQPEQEHFNNLLQIPFYVGKDDINPILDVTFDGRHILNGDIVSPSSEIYITLKDENPLLIMDNVADTARFGVYLTGPDGVQKKIPFMDGSGNVIMQWIPADLTNKRFKIIFPASFEVDGKYSLLVQGSDRSGNLSGDIQYKISFEIIRESSITYLMNYPNPFSTSTRFVFTLTGTEVPQDMIIQIMTVTGKVVREITESELGQIYIGRNISTYDWNGTDEFGDPLANGVYLYRVKCRIGGEDIKHRDSGADSHFTKDFGKMYILR
jgi:hypothetical protein